jgi:hypothetical protein
MDPFKLLSEDHQRLLELSNELTGGAGEPGGTEKQRRRTAQQLVIEGSKHEAIEEQFFWPVVRDRLDGGQPLAFAGIQQEMGGRSLLHELNHIRAGNVHFMTIVFTLASTIRDHLTYEENQVWPKLQLALGDEELEIMGTAMAAARRLAPTRPHPHTPPDARLMRAVGPVAGALDRARDVLTGRGR